MVIEFAGLTLSTRTDGANTFVTYSFPRRIDRSGTSGETVLTGSAGQTLTATPKAPPTTAIDDFPHKLRDAGAFRTDNP